MVALVRILDPVIIALVLMDLSVLTVRRLHALQTPVSATVYVQLMVSVTSAHVRPDIPALIAK